MPLLKLRFKNTILKEYPLPSGQTLTIGRSDANDIIIDNMSVSSLHARIDSVSATYILTDLESTNGTFVNEELIATHTLRDQDVILIGKHELLFEKSDENKPGEEPGENDEDKTRYRDTAEYRELINKSMGVTNSHASEPQEGSHQQGGFFRRLLKKLFG